MTPERWRRIEQVLEGALDRAPGARDSFLDSECAGDPELRGEVESLLGSSGPAEAFLQSNALADAASLLVGPEAGLAEGERLGSYTIKGRIGSGGMGEVYLAEDERLGRRVALKLLAPELAADETARARFLREARLAASLDHPNVCTIHEVGEERGHPFIAMQYVEGRTLRQLSGGEPLPLGDLLSISLQVADALAAAHERGIVHRDVKPGNIIVSPRGRAVVLDFGLAKLSGAGGGRAEVDLTVTGQIMGTVAAMSPEQAKGGRVDRRSDIFSFGCVLYEMATGRAPFEGESRAEVVAALLALPHAPASDLNEDVPADLSAVIDRALTKDPGERYQSMADVMADLRRVASHADGQEEHSQSSGAPRAAPRRGGPSGAPRRAWATAAVAGAVLALAVTALAYYLSRTRPPAAHVRTLAVLPFKPLGGGERDEVLELGMADTLIARLTNVREIEVRPVSAIHRYTGLGQDAIAAGREQGVDAVLDGHVQQAGGRVRVTVRLLRVRDGAPLWGDKFDAEAGDIFAVQDSISERVASALEVRLQGGERELLTKHHTEDAEAYGHYLTGRYHLNRLTDDGFLKGRDEFLKAVGRDPRYAAAYAGLAEAYNRLGGWNARAPAEVFPQAREAAKRALELDARLAEAHTQMAVVQFLYDWDFAGAEEEFRQAIKLNPDSADAHQMYGFYLSAMGRSDEALAEAGRARELDPLSLEKVTGVGDIFFQRRQYDRAEEHYRKALEMDPNSGFAHWALGNVRAARGMYEEAVAEYQKAMPLSGDSPDELASFGYACARAGRRRDAQAVIARLEEQSTRRYISPTIVAFIYAGLADKDRAFQWLDKALEGRDFILVLLKVEPTFDGLRADPRFAELVRRVGLPQ